VLRVVVCVCVCVCQLTGVSDWVVVLPPRQLSEGICPWRPASKGSASAHDRGCTGIFGNVE
jgi:hypothetical protein